MEIDSGTDSEDDVAGNDEDGGIGNIEDHGKGNNKDSGAGDDEDNGAGNNEDTIMGGDGNENDDGNESEESVEFEGCAKAVNPSPKRFVATRSGIVGKGKAANDKVPSSHKTSVPSNKKAKKANDEQSGPNKFLRRCIPATYEVVLDPLEDDELVELDWFAPARTGAVQAESSKKGKKNTTACVKGVPTPASQVLPTRCWHSFSATKMTLDAELANTEEVRLLDGRFSFPFNAQVIQ